MSKQLSFKKWGGRRAGAGRPNRTKSVNHMKREAIDVRRPLHLTLRLKEQMPNLRQKRLLKEFQRGIQLAAKQGLYVIQYSLQTNHLHLIVEAKDNEKLARGAQSLASRFAKIIRRLKGGRGSVFVGRYHLRVIRSALQMKRTLCYVLLNSAKHQNLIEHLDFYSSGYTFKHWSKLLGRNFTGVIRREVDEVRAKLKLVSDVFEARSWLASKGWMRVP